MLISVEVENFRSFYDRTIFSMETGSKLRSYSTTNTHRFKQLKLLKSALVGMQMARQMLSIFFTC